MKGNAYTRALAIYKAVRVVYKVNKIQYADATYFEKQPDTFYVPPYFFFATARKYSAEVLARMDAFGYGILHILPEHLKERVVSYQAGLRTNLGPRKATAYRQAALTGWQAYRQIKDK